MTRKLFCRTALFLALPSLLFFTACNQKDSAPVDSSGATEKPAADSVTENVSAPVSNAVSPVEKESEPTSGISGKIILKGTPSPERELPLTADCGKLHSTIPKTRFYVVGEDGALADVFVFIKEGLDGKTFPAPTEPVLLDQVGCEYTPYVIGLQTGQKLLVRNSDPMMHNVHAMPVVSGNKESNKAQMTKSPDLEYTFDTPEIFLRFKCDIHPWMYAYVGVVDNPFFAVTKADGTFQLKNVPDGRYVVEAYHRKAGKQTKETTVTNGKSDALNFTFELPASL